MTGYGFQSLWLDQLSDELEPRAPLDSDKAVDVAIVGAGYTGLWTAYYLLRADPSLRVALIEKEIAGFGASGRNGGWCSALFAASNDHIAKRYGHEQAERMQRAMIDTLDETEKVLVDEAIDAHWIRGGTLTLATSPAHQHRVREIVTSARRWGMGLGDYVWLDRDETSARIRVPGIVGAAFTPHCARVHPARLVRGLARVVEKNGAAIYEQTAATTIDGRRVLTNRGTVTADAVVLATEAYTAELPGMKRRLIPLYSLMIATEPLPESFWSEVGWSGYETLTDGRHLLIYAQRTSDDRIAFGGRGAPYNFGSRIDDSLTADSPVFDELTHVLHEMFPAARDHAITHRWGGPIGVPRDWFTSVGYDRSSGLAHALGYVGDGVSTTNLAGRTLADLITGTPSDLTTLPWVGHRSRKWEPEPARWTGVNLALRAMGWADGSEKRSGRPVKWVDKMSRLIGLD